MKTFLSILGVIALIAVIYLLGVTKGFSINIFGNKPPVIPPADNCDPNKLGWNKNGFPDTNCGFGRTAIPLRICINRNGQMSAPPAIISSGVEYKIEYATQTTFCYKRA